MDASPVVRSAVRKVGYSAGRGDEAEPASGGKARVGGGAEWDGRGWNWQNGVVRSGQDICGV